MNANMDPLVVDHQFFAALIQSDFQALDKLLAHDFILIDVMTGAETKKSSLLAAMASKHVSFESIQPSENRVRLYSTTAVVTGRTEIKGRLEGTTFSISSRYTHVYVVQQGEWRLVAAQGTRVS